MERRASPVDEEMVVWSVKAKSSELSKAGVLFSAAPVRVGTGKDTLETETSGGGGAWEEATTGGATSAWETGSGEGAGTGVGGLTGAGDGSGPAVLEGAVKLSGAPPEGGLSRGGVVSGTA